MVPTVEGLLTTPYVTVAEFSAAPTWLDVDDLIPGGTAARQQDELYNVLLRASQWADNFCGQRLGAHVAYEQMRGRIDKYGQTFIHPSNVPVRQVLGIAYGSDFQFMTPLTDLTQVWIEDARGIVVSTIPFRGSFTGTLEFGSLPVGDDDVFIEIQYVAGYACTTLSGSVTAGATSLPVVNPTGFQGPFTSVIATVPGSTARIWDANNPGLEEAVTVGSSYVSGSSPLVLSSGTLFAHTVGTGPAGQIGVDELPPDVHQAVIAMAVALMMREDVTGDEPFVGAPYGPATRRAKDLGKAGGLLDTAYELLEPYRRVR